MASGSYLCLAYLLPLAHLIDPHGLLQLRPVQVLLLLLLPSLPPLPRRQRAESADRASALGHLAYRLRNDR